MYTKCPECETTFRLSAAVLRQAQGRVRCGGCGDVFNALDHLSEELPAPNLTDTQTAKIFEKESRALLETLDELAGDDDVRIEDTGAEWQVVDDELDEVLEAAGAADDADAAAAEREPAADDRHRDDGYDEVAAGGEDDEPEDAGIGAAGDDSDAATGTAEPRWTFVDGPQSAAPPAAGDETDAEPAAVGPAAVVEAPPQAALDLGHASADEAELRFDDNTPLPDEYYRPVTVPAAATPRRRATDREEFAVSQPAGDSPQVDLELDGDDWRELLAEVEGDELAADEGEYAAADDGMAAVADDEFAASAATGDPAAEDDAGEPAALADSADLAAVPELRPPPDDTAAVEAAGADDDTVEAEVAAPGAEPGAEDQWAPDDDDTATVAEDELLLDEEPAEQRDGDAAAAAAEAGDSEIDRDLLEAAASGDIDATSTHSRYRLWDEDPTLVETIVMEGDSISDMLSEAGDGEPGTEPGAADGEEPGREADAEVDLDGGGLAATGTERPAAMTPRQRYLGIAAIVLLGLLLLGQLVHANRESLATLGLFDRTLAPLYAAFGSPVAPAWDVRGWQFESTSGSTDETGNRLTINSRIANRTSDALPYPLVHVSLTDRFDEVIGSRLLAPDEYLAGNGAIGRPVPAGDAFTAVITVDAPSPDATGFKLNVCYPVAGRRVRCAIEDFRD